jgi:Eukaryotic membrane protein family
MPSAGLADDQTLGQAPPTRSPSSRTLAFMAPDDSINDVSDAQVHSSAAAKDDHSGASSIKGSRRLINDHTSKTSSTEQDHAGRISTKEARSHSLNDASTNFAYRKPLGDSTNSANKPILRLPSAEIVKLTSTPLTPIAFSPLPSPFESYFQPTITEQYEAAPSASDIDAGSSEDVSRKSRSLAVKGQEEHGSASERLRPKASNGKMAAAAVVNGTRPGVPSRTLSTPPYFRRKKSNSRGAEGHQRPKLNGPSPSPFDLKESKVPSNLKPLVTPNGPIPSPGQQYQIPPLSLPTYLQLELAADRREQYEMATDFPYESSAVKFERLRNFLLLPGHLELLLWFGTAACLDSWLYIFTILPIRFCVAANLLLKWWVWNAWKEVHDLVEFVYLGLGRLWQRVRHPEPQNPPNDPGSSQKRKRAVSAATGVPARENESIGIIHAWPDPPKRIKTNNAMRHKRTRSTPSLLQPSHKADLLKGLLVILGSIFMMQLDPSIMYHNIRGQSAVKLYVIYNALEVSDKLLSSIGQDIMECLFSREVLERHPDGRSKIIRPLWVFVMALVYTIVHTSSLLYQAISLNVAVNSYSNALLSLLMSNQFVEIKGAVFKKIEKENLFQLACADVVERFQTWLMLLIIVMRNVVEVGGLSMPGPNSPSSTASDSLNTTGSFPLKADGILPQSFTILPKLTGQVLGPFVVVLGIEMLVDWFKHAYVNKFNDCKPAIYGRFLDVLARDYYKSAFQEQNLIKRIGLPVIPLACLFVRAAIQAYNMFLATHLPLHLASSATSLSVESEAATATSSPGAAAALAHVDNMFRRALGRAAYQDAPRGAWYNIMSYTIDDFLAGALLVLVALIGFLALLAAKLVLGMVMLRWARKRCEGSREREKMNVAVGTRRLGINGMVEMDDEKRKLIYEDDEAGLAKARARENAMKNKEKGKDLNSVTRYAMVAKRIW